jgi:hypothetical protein
MAVSLAVTARLEVNFEHWDGVASVEFECSWKLMYIVAELEMSRQLAELVLVRVIVKSERAIDFKPATWRRRATVTVAQ